MKRIRRTYQQRIFIYFFLLFTAFLVSILSFQYKREKNYRTAQLETRLDHVAGVISGYIEHNGMLITDHFAGLDSLKNFLES